jgi:hypothetical protein
VSGMTGNGAARLDCYRNWWHGTPAVRGTVPKKGDFAKMRIAISIREVFYIQDGAICWEPRISGTLADFLPVEFSDLGQCVQKQLPAKGGDRLYLKITAAGIERIYRSPNDPAGRRTPAKFVRARVASGQLYKCH